MMTNKEAQEKLIDFFNNQDSNTVSHMLAGLFLDLNRINVIEQLTPEQKEILFRRIKFNCKQIYSVLRGENKNGLKIKYQDEI